MAKVSTSKEVTARDGAAASYRADPARAAEAQPELVAAARVEARIAQAAARQAMPEAARTLFREAVREEIAARIADDRLLPPAGSRGQRSSYREVIVLEGQAAKETYERIQVDAAGAIGKLLRTERPKAGRGAIRDQPTTPPGATVADIEIAGRHFYIHASIDRVTMYEAIAGQDRRADLSQRGRSEGTGAPARSSTTNEMER